MITHITESPDRLLDSAEVARISKLGTTRLANTRCGGKGARHIRLRGRVDYREGDVQAWLAKRRANVKHAGR